MLEIPETNILIKIVATFFFGCLLVSWYFCVHFDLCIMQSMQNKNKNKKTNANEMNCNSFLDQMNRVELWIPSKCSKILVKEQQKLMIPSIIIMTSLFCLSDLNRLIYFWFFTKLFIHFWCNFTNTNRTVLSVVVSIWRMRQEFCIINAINCGKVFVRVQNVTSFRDSIESVSARKLFYLCYIIDFGAVASISSKNGRRWQRRHTLVFNIFKQFTECDNVLIEKFVLSILIKCFSNLIR